MMHPNADSPEESPPSRRPDPLLLWEVALVLVLLVLFALLLLLPAAREPLRPHWFAAPILAIALFGLLLLDRRRRTAARQRAVDQVVEEEALDEAEAEEIGEERGP